MSDKEKVSQWMMDKGYATGHGTSVGDLLQELEWQVAEREREACAKLCEEDLRDAYICHGKPARDEALLFAAICDCAKAIRARGEK